jgi:hypothetical protein
MRLMDCTAYDMERQIIELALFSLLKRRWQAAHLRAPRQQKIKRASQQHHS